MADDSRVTRVEQTRNLGYRYQHIRACARDGEKSSGGESRVHSCICIYPIECCISRCKPRGRVSWSVLQTACTKIKVPDQRRVFRAALQDAPTAVYVSFRGPLRAERAPATLWI